MPCIHWTVCDYNHDIGPSGMAYDSIVDDDMLSTVLSERPRCCYSYYVAKLSYSYMTVV